MNVLVGDEIDAFERLVQRHSRFVFQVAWSVLRNAHDAEDVVQETFLKVYRARAWEHMQDQRAFLARAAWRLAVDRRKTALREGPMPQLIAPEANQDTGELVRRVIERLPEELRQPLTLSALDEMTSREIGMVMGIPEGTVRTRVMRAREILRKKLEALGYD